MPSGTPWIETRIEDKVEFLLDEVFFSFSFFRKLTEDTRALRDALSIPFFDGLIYLVAQQFITLKDVLSIFNVDVWPASVKVESNGNRIAAGSNQCSSE